MILTLILKFTKTLCCENLELYSIYIVLLRNDVPYKPKKGVTLMQPSHMASDRQINVNAPCDEGYRASLYA